MSLARKAASIATLAATVALSAVMMATMAYGAVSGQAVSSPSYVAALNAPAVLQVRPAALPAARSVAVIAPARPAVARIPNVYRVRSGDTLSVISAREYGKSADWPLLYWANSKTIRYADVIYVGQKLKIPAKTSRIPAPPRTLAPVAPAPAPQAAVVETASVAKISPPPSSYSVGSSFQACVIRAESGGNPGIWNASGHYGLYQFSESTWDAAGGDPSLFGHASAAYQTKVFWMAYDQWGTSPWAPYDGCL
jgi:LysM repeat protein